MKDSDADLDFVRSLRRKRRFSPSKYVPLLIVLGLFGVTSAIIVGVVLAKALPTLGKDNWTHVELANYLQSQGIVVYRYPGRAGVYYMGYPAQNGVFLEELASHWWSNGDDIVIVNMASSPTRAKEIASESETSFAWGRFIINGTGNYAAAIRTALGEPSAVTARKRTAEKAAQDAKGPSLSEVLDRAVEWSKQKDAEDLEKIRKQNKKQ